MLLLLLLSLFVQYVLLVFSFNFKRSFRNNLIIIPVGVITKKNTKHIITGEIILPNKIPNLNQILFNGVSNLEFISPNARKIREIAKHQSLISFLFNNGHKAINKKTIKKTIPKFLLVGNFIFFA